MPFWNWTGTPPYAEEIIINEEQQIADLENERDKLTQDKKELEQKVEQIQETLNQFKQLVPEDFIQIETDYIFTTKSKWNNKPLSERYSFEYEGEWLQIDIPHPIMESLKLERGKEIPYPVYLEPKVLKREPTFGGKTVNNEKELFLKKPFTVENLEEDIDKLFDKIKELRDEKGKLEKKNEKQGEKLTQKDDEINSLKNEIRKLKNELDKEKGWWDKCIINTDKKQKRIIFDYSYLKKNIEKYGNSPEDMSWRFEQELLQKVKERYIQIKNQP